MEQRLINAIMEAAQAAGGRLPCPRAFLIARRLGVTPAQVGAAADAAGISISNCQLGLFGYGSKAEGKHKIVQAMNPVPEALAGRLTAAGDAQGRITCAAVWEVARRSRVSRLTAASAAEGLGLRIVDCQLGCFKKPAKTGQQARETT